MIALFILFCIFALVVYLRILDNQIRSASLKNRVNTYTKDRRRKDDSQVRVWYKKTFTREYNEYIYDLSPFKSSLWIVSILDRKSFNRYISIDQFNVVVVLASLHLVMIDKRFTAKELNHINAFYSRFFDAKKRSDLIWLLGLYKKNKIDLVSSLLDNFVLETVIEGINAYFLKQHKYTLIYYLFELAEADKEISNEELKFIFSLAKSIKLTKSEVNSITSLYFSSYIPYPNVEFKQKQQKTASEKTKTTAQQEKAKQDRTNTKRKATNKRKKQNQRQYKKTYSSYSRVKYTSKSKLENALDIFGLDKTATNEEIKRAYKKMVRKHHPDKVAHLGEEHVLKATEIFKKINVAYDYLEQVRGL